MNNSFKQTLAATLSVCAIFGLVRCGGDDGGGGAAVQPVSSTGTGPITPNPTATPTNLNGTINLVGDDGIGNIFVTSDRNVYLPQYGALVPVGETPLSDGPITAMGGDGLGHFYVASGSTLYALPFLCVDNYNVSSGSAVSSGGSPSSTGTSSGATGISAGSSAGYTSIGASDGSSTFCTSANWFPGQYLTAVGQTIDGSAITAIGTDSAGNVFTAAGPYLYITNQTYAASVIPKLSVVGVVPSGETINLVGSTETGIYAQKTASVYVAAGASLYSIPQFSSAGVSTGSVGTSSGGAAALSWVGTASGPISLLAGDAEGNIFAASGSDLYVASTTGVRQLTLNWSSADGSAFTALKGDKNGFIFAAAGANLYRVQYGCTFNSAFANNVAYGADCYSAAANTGVSPLIPSGTAKGTISSLYVLGDAIIIHGTTQTGAAMSVPVDDLVYVSSGNTLYQLNFKVNSADAVTGQSLVADGQTTDGASIIGIDGLVAAGGGVYTYANKPLTLWATLPSANVTNFPVGN